MATHVDIQKKKGESTAQMLRRFSRSFRDTGISRTIRGRRYFKRKDSELRSKESAMARISNGKKYAMMRKMGTLPPSRHHRSR